MKSIHEEYPIAKAYSKLLTVRACEGMVLASPAMILTVRKQFVKAVLILIEVALFTLAAVWIALRFAATVEARTPNLRNLKMAVRLASGDSNYRLRLGRLYEYDPETMDTKKALREFHGAAELNPGDPRAWMALGMAYALAGDTAKADAQLRRASLLAPNTPEYQWTIGNTFLVQGKVDEAFRHLRIVFAGSDRYDQVLMDTAWKASGDPGKILNELIPRNPAKEFPYLYYLVAHNHPRDAWAVWRRIASDPKPFPAASAASYIDSLIASKDVVHASNVWNDLIGRGAVVATHHPSSGNLLFDGDFEDPWVNMGFSWRDDPVAGAKVGLDESEFHSPGHSLLIEFTGEHNLNFDQVYEYALVKPSTSYVFHGFIMTKHVTTDSGVRIQVFDPNQSPGPLAESQNFKGSTPGWTPVTLNFKTEPTASLVVVRVLRLPSDKLDNKISGRVWLDDFSLTATPSPNGVSQSREE